VEPLRRETPAKYVIESGDPGAQRSRCPTAVRSEIEVFQLVQDGFGGEAGFSTSIRVLLDVIHHTPSRPGASNRWALPVNREWFL
jgi:hypothetical protein